MKPPVEGCVPPQMIYFLGWNTHCPMQDNGQRVPLAWVFPVPCCHPCLHMKHGSIGSSLDAENSQTELRCAQSPKSAGIRGISSVLWMHARTPTDLCLHVKHGLVQVLARGSTGPKEFPAPCASMPRSALTCASGKGKGHHGSRHESVGL